jgi:hypothetical protein
MRRASVVLSLVGVAASWSCHGQVGENAGPPISRSFSAVGVKKVIFRAASAATADVSTDATAEVVEISGTPVGGASGYHSENPSWRETSPAEWGLDWESVRYGEVLVISSKNEIGYIHHHYRLTSVAILVPSGVEVVRQKRELTGDGSSDLREPE